MSSLYQITENYDAVLNMLYDEEMDEQTILDTLESIEGEFEDKADGYAKLYKTLKYDADTIQTEIDRLRSRLNTFENRAQSLKDTLEANMKQIGKTKFKTTLFSFGIQKNGGKQPLKIDALDVNTIPAEYLIPQDPLPNNEKIRELLEKQKVAWAHLEPRGESLRIR
ncbi:siphovirus Gp157 family protein [Clostridium sp. KNHs205]|uniref:siphovirus Gp157 family protein n=1 Tax=Clostridium sp. KNHs205 TaxID=1449050 RepID=UPI00051BDF29|nr:siphovirus Gp157 family protein [Clostridium sp. KNHs205]